MSLPPNQKGIASKIPLIHCADTYIVLPPDSYRHIKQSQVWKKTSAYVCLVKCNEQPFFVKHFLYKTVV